MKKFILAALFTMYAATAQAEDPLTEVIERSLDLVVVKYYEQGFADGVECMTYVIIPQLIHAQDFGVELDVEQLAAEVVDCMTEKKRKYGLEVKK